MSLATQVSSSGLTLIGDGKDLTVMGDRLVEEGEFDKGHKAISDGKRAIASGQQKLEEAKVYYKQLLASEPESGMYNNNYGWVLMKLGEYQQAAIYLKKAQKNKSTVNPSFAPGKNLEKLKELMAFEEL